MKTRFLLAIPVIAAAVSIIFVIVIFEYPSLNPSPEHYEIEITGLKDTYLVGEPYSFSFILSGYGYSCGGVTITWPVNKTSSQNTGWIPSCAQTLPSSFIIDEKKEYGRTYGHIALDETGNYTVSVKFERGTDGPTIAEKSFRVISRDNQTVSEQISLANQKCADLFDGVIQKLKDERQRCSNLGVECEPAILEYVLRENSEFMNSRCADSVNNWHIYPKTKR